MYFIVGIRINRPRFKPVFGRMVNDVANNSIYIATTNSHEATVFETKEEAEKELLDFYWFPTEDFTTLVIHIDDLDDTLRAEEVLLQIGI